MESGSQRRKRYVLECLLIEMIVSGARLMKCFVACLYGFQAKDSRYWKQYY